MTYPEEVFCESQPLTQRLGVRFHNGEPNSGG